MSVHVCFYQINIVQGSMFLIERTSERGQKKLFQINFSIGIAGSTNGSGSTLWFKDPAGITCFGWQFHWISLCTFQEFETVSLSTNFLPAPPGFLEKENINLNKISQIQIPPWLLYKGMNNISRNETIYVNILWIFWIAQVYSPLMSIAGSIFWIAALYTINNYIN